MQRDAEESNKTKLFEFLEGAILSIFYMQILSLIKQNLWISVVYRSEYIFNWKPFCSVNM